MRLITKQAVTAFMRDENFKKSNTIVDVSYGSVGMYLHGNLIAIKKIRRNDSIRISTAGWNTMTTRERLNGLGCNITNRKGQLYLGGVKWDGSFKTI